MEAFDESPLPLELYTPPIGCDTAEVYKTFKKYFLPDISLSSFAGWDQIKSEEILKTIHDPTLLNDLYPAAKKACPKLAHHAKPGWFFSGSGSTFFRPLPTVL